MVRISHRPLRLVQRNALAVTYRCSIRRGEKSSPRKAKDRDCGIPAADIGSNHVVHPHETRDDGQVLHAASIVGDHTASRRATEGTSQQHLAGPSVKRQQITIHFTGENQVACGGRDTGYHWFRGVVAPLFFTRGSVESSEASTRG